MVPDTEYIFWSPADSHAYPCIVIEANGGLLSALCSLFSGAARNKETGWQNILFDSDNKHFTYLARYPQGVEESQVMGRPKPGGKVPNNK